MRCTGAHVDCNTPLKCLQWDKVELLVVYFISTLLIYLIAYMPICTLQVINIPTVFSKYCPSCHFHCRSKNKEVRKQERKIILTKQMKLHHLITSYLYFYRPLIIVIVFTRASQHPRYEHYPWSQLLTRKKNSHTNLIKTTQHVNFEIYIVCKVRLVYWARFSQTLCAIFLIWRTNLPSYSLSCLVFGDPGIFLPIHWISPCPLWQLQDHSGRCAYTSILQKKNSM